MRTIELQTAIVGGGVSGAYAGWRLARAGREGLGLFEYSPRVGGRLMSFDVPGIKVKAELGGMRFLSSHHRVVKLVEQFGLPQEELLVGDPEGRNLYYLRGNHFTEADWKAPSFRPPYQLDRHEKARSPGDLLHAVALKYQHQAESLRDVGFWNLLLDEYSDEAYRLIQDAGGYDTIVNNWSAAEAIPFLIADFAPGLRYMKLLDGFDSLPRTLAKRFESLGGQVCMQHRLHRIDYDSSAGKFRLLFDTSGNNRARITPAEEDALMVEAEKVILAMPRRSIELLHPESVLFQSAEFESALKSVLPQAAFKLFAAYATPWWAETRGVVAGRSATDLPIRQCYYWQTGNAESPIGQKNSMLMASYNDGGSVDFWAGLARDSERYQPNPEFCPPGVGIPDFVQNQSASRRLVAEMQNQLRELHGLNTDPKHSAAIDPYVAIFQDWTQEPFGGGWHFWKIGADARKVMQLMQQPIPDLPLHVCGEAWSRQQGWVEGALETTDDLLMSQFGIDLGGEQ